jgi:hypothetical protein
MQQAYEMNFTTGAPSVIGTDPANRQIKSDWSPAAPIHIFFNAEMDHTTLNPDILSIRPALTQAPTLYANEDPQTGWTRLAIQAIWQPGTVYQITVGRRARTLAHSALANVPYTFSFQTDKLSQFQPPEPPGPTGLNMGTGNRRVLQQP